MGQDRLLVPGCPGCWPGCCPNSSWQHPRTCPWISCCCCLVDCTDCPRWSACSPCGQEASCCTSHSWKHPWTVPGSEAARQWWTNQLLWKQQQAHHVGKRQASVPLTPGNIAGLVPGSAAAAAWWAALIAHRGQLAHHVKREATQYPLTPGNIPGL